MNLTRLWLERFSKKPISRAIGLGVVLVPATAFTTQGIVCTLGGGSVYNPMYDQQPTQYAYAVLQEVENLLCSSGCGEVFLVLNNTTPNALTWTAGGGRSKIAYSADFMNQLYYQIGESAAFGVMAHEFGHHIDLNRPGAWMDHSWNRELRADAWAGCALARASLGTEELSIALRAIAAYPSPSHPQWPLRQQALEAGYRQCNGEEELDAVIEEERVGEGRRGSRAESLASGLRRLAEALDEGNSATFQLRGRPADREGEYHLSFAIPGLEECTVTRNATRVRCSPRFDSRSEAEETYEEIVAALRSTQPTSGWSESDDSDGEGVYEGIRFENPDNRSNISVEYRRSGRYYRVTLVAWPD